VTQRCKIELLKLVPKKCSIINAQSSIFNGNAVHYAFWPLFVKDATYQILMSFVER